MKAARVASGPSESDDGERREPHESFSFLLLPRRRRRLASLASDRVGCASRPATFDPQVWHPFASMRPRLERIRHVATASPDVSDAGTKPSTYRERRPPEPLSGVVECLWRRERWRAPTRDLGVLPDGRVDVTWASDGTIVVIGPQSRALMRPLPEDVVVVGVRFWPGDGPRLLGVPAHELANLHVSLEAIDARPAMALCRDLAAIEDPRNASMRVADAVARRLNASKLSSTDVVVRRAAALLGNSEARIEQIAKALSLSERQLQRRFREAVGYGPKTLQRVLRFQRLLEALWHGSEHAGGFASIAAAIGYADQAHLTRETRALSGLSPLRLERNLAMLGNEGARGIFKTGGLTRGGAYTHPTRTT